MRIAFTHNLKLSDAEEEAEFDTPATVGMITEALRRLGHEVEPVEVSGPASRAVARLEALAPDLVFNTAEGTRGRFREAFYPGLFDRLGMPYTGSDAYVCALTLDKNLTKMMLRDHGVRSPRGLLVTAISQLPALADFRFPVIAKPNYEGSSMGITVDSVVDDLDTLKARLVQELARFPAGILVEEFIVGRDVVVPWLEKGPAATHGILEPASYAYKEDFVAHRKYRFFDFSLKQMGFDAVHVVCPAELSPALRTELMEQSSLVFHALGVHDAARIDFRVTDDGVPYFLEINALPSLEAGASLYVSGERAGLKAPDDVLAAIVESAAERFGLTLTKTRRRRRPLVHVALIVDPHGPDETGPGITVQLDQVLRSYGHEPVTLEATPELATLLPGSGADMAFNLASGRGASRIGARVPALAELCDLPCTGSDAGALALFADPGVVRRLVKEVGIQPTPYQVIHSSKTRLDKSMTFPLTLRAGHGGVSATRHLVNDEPACAAMVEKLLKDGHAPLLAEPVPKGRRIAVTLLGERRPRALPPVEIDPVTGVPLDKKVAGALSRRLERAARLAFTTLGCRDFATFHFVVEAKDVIHYLVCHCVPDLHAESPLRVAAERAGIDLRTLVGELIAPALRRMRELRRERLLAARLSS